MPCVEGLTYASLSTPIWTGGTLQEMLLLVEVTAEPPVTDGCCSSIHQHSRRDLMADSLTFVLRGEG